MQTYDFNAPANSPFVVHAAGKYIKYLSGNNGGGDVSLIITPGSNPGNKLTLVPGQAFRVADDAKTPDSWTLTNAVGGATILGKVVVGNGKIDDNSIAGTVQVIDGGKTRTLSGSAYSCAAPCGTPAASVYSRSQLWNPANSGKRLVVESVTMVAPNGATGVSALSFVGAALTTAVGLAPSKLPGGPVSAAVICSDTIATLPTGLALGQFQAPSSGAFTFVPKEPYVVLPGYGLVNWSLQSNLGFATWFEWYEEPNV